MEFSFLFLSPEKSKVAAAQTVLDLDQMTLFFLARMSINLTSPSLWSSRGDKPPNYVQNYESMCAFWASLLASYFQISDFL